MTCTVSTLPGSCDRARLLVLGLLSAEASEAAQAIRCRAPLEPWTQVELYFGRGLGGDAVVSEEAFRDFVAQDVTPLFPDGLSVIDVAGQFRDSEGAIVREPAKLLILLVPDVAAVAPDVGMIIAAYKERFDQQSVLHASNPSASRLSDFFAHLSDEVFRLVILTASIELMRSDPQRREAQAVIASLVMTSAPSRRLTSRSPGSSRSRGNS